MSEKTASPSSSREVFERLHERVRDDYDMDGQADLYAEDGTLELPFAPAGMLRQVQGREEIREFLGKAGRRAREAGRRILRYDPLVVHETADPEVIVAEFDLHGEVFAAGETYQMSFIQVLRVRDGQIVSMRDYFTTETVPAVFETGATRGSGEKSQAEAMRALIHRSYESFNTRDIDLVDEIYAPGFVSHPLNTVGVRAVKDSRRTFAEAFPDAYASIEEMLVDGDKVATRTTIKGVSRSPQDSEPTIMEIFRVEHGRIAELWGIATNLARH